MQPVMEYDKGYCRPECNACSQVCPAGAIKPVSVEQKLAVRIGVAHVNLDLCLPATGKDSCGNCAYHCPSGAIRMVRQSGSRMQIPTVSEDRCIGCGACENLCPSRPISAITVNGLSIHHNA
jgi:ferredoxin